MSNVVQFKARSAALEEVIEVMDIAYEKLATLQMEIDSLQDAADGLQEAYDRELKAMAHRLGGIEHCPVDYLLYTTLDSDVIKTIEEKLWKETGSPNTHTNTTST